MGPALFLASCVPEANAAWGTTHLCHVLSSERLGFGLCTGCIVCFVCLVGIYRVLQITTLCNGNGQDGRVCFVIGVRSAKGRRLSD